MNDRFRQLGSHPLEMKTLFKRQTTRRNALYTYTTTDDRLPVGGPRLMNILMGNIGSAGRKNTRPRPHEPLTERPTSGLTAGGPAGDYDVNYFWRGRPGQNTLCVVSDKSNAPLLPKSRFGVPL